MLRQQAFEGSGRMLKGGLHNHTTRSDGAVKPEDVIRMFAFNGYDFLALTDHNIYNFKNFAPETGITVIPGVECENTVEKMGSGFRCHHIVCLGPEKDGGNGFGQDELFEHYNFAAQEDMQKILDDIHAKNNITFYAHPGWSSTPPRYFDKLKGNFAIEIYNTGCAVKAGTDYNAMYWDDLLGRGMKIYGVAVDDGHKCEDYCRGWVMVNAGNTVPDILNALRSGAFYSSCGPEIRDFYYDDGKVCVTCSPVSSVRFVSEGHPMKLWRDDRYPVTHWEMPVDASGFDYIRAEVTDEKGRKAWTNPIFFKDAPGK